METNMSDPGYASSSYSSPSPPALPQCDYTDWSPSYSIIPSVYLLAFLVGCLGNGLVLWAYLNRAEGRKAGRTSRTTGGATAIGRAFLGKIFLSSRYDVRSGGVLRGDRLDGTFGRYTATPSGGGGAPPCSHPTSSVPSPPRPPRSLTDSLIASLALADLCFLVTLPLWAAYTALGYHWPFGQPLCQVSSFLTALNMYASVFSLSMLSVERYWVLIGRQHSGHHAPNGRPGRTRWVLGGVWALAGVLALPGFLLRSVIEVELGEDAADYDWTPGPAEPSAYPGGDVLLSCQMDYSVLIGDDLSDPERERAKLWWAAALSLKSTLIGFLLPLVVLLACYCSLAHLLSRHFGRGPRPDRRRQRRLLRVIVSLVLAFFLCWLPLHVNKTADLLLELGLVPYSCSLDQALLAAQPYVTCLAYLNSCLNPLLYAACDSSFRRRCREALLLQCPSRRTRKRRSQRGSKAREEAPAEGGGGGGGDGEGEDEKSSAFPTRTQEETADGSGGEGGREEEEGGREEEKGREEEEEGRKAKGIDVA
ncbi:apelin receptor 2 [Gadus morhua]|uniref:G-protein coupled receptors family 1 profile domain-containing protein n=1 Tax=Gadus morhua TaxID=8049 RepID=A0A8C5FPB3_GADMO|nr:apelin receptor B-like [Gadus morhua]